jgi:HEAT repeat protein
LVVFALSGARPGRVMEALQQAQRHRNESVRYAAAVLLAGFGTAATREPLVAALRDRSHMVRSVARDALTRRKHLQTPAAIQPLRRIVANRRTCFFAVPSRFT